MATIELLTIANHAEVQNGLLYMMGAEWDTVTRRYAQGESPQPQHLAVALTAVVPWTEANDKHRVEIWIEDEDGNQLIAAGFDLEVGRPPGRAHGSDTRAPFTLTANVPFPKEGGYRVQATVAESRRTYSFRVVDQVTHIAQAS